MGHFRYTQEQLAFVEAHVKGRTSNELTAMFNERFGTDRAVSHIRALCKNRGWKNGMQTSFRKGHVPFNKGQKGLYTGGEAGKVTQFKKGNRPANYKPVGTERINGEGYIDVKIADPGVWKAKHVMLWEEAHGPIPKGHVLVFGDGDKMNIEVSNLVLVSRQQLAVMNRNGLIQKDADLTRTGVLIADLYRKINVRKQKRAVRGERREKMHMDTESRSEGSDERIARDKVRVEAVTAEMVREAFSEGRGSDVGNVPAVRQEKNI